jgi:serine-type D-Ala-D-Ala carboxypeptidase (penicillin-binding protein 5/6)
VRGRLARLFAALTLGISSSVFALAPAGTAVAAAPGGPPRLAARAAILIDAATGRVLYQLNADAPFVPASLAKLMSLHIVYEKLADRSISPTDVVGLTANAWADNQAPGSTLMHLAPGQIVTVDELMKGVAVASGNDAATALAEYVAGSRERFVAMMNEEARYFGYSITHYSDPAGLGTDNRVSAREFADFCRRYIALHPQALRDLHSLREFDYPLAQNMPDGKIAPGKTLKQYNGNYLVWDGDVDGLKTGHLDKDSFTAAITAHRGSMRLIAVLLGVSGASLKDGARNRAEDGLALLGYGFRSFATVTLDAPAMPGVRVWKGTAAELAIAPEGPIQLTLRPDERDTLEYTLLATSPIVAPVIHGQKIGDLVYTAGGDEVGRFPVVATADVDAAGPLVQAWDTTVLGISSALGDLTTSLRMALDSAPASPVLSTRTHESQRRAP